MWFAALNSGADPWLVHLADKLFAADLLADGCGSTTHELLGEQRYLRDAMARCQRPGKAATTAVPERVQMLPYTYAFDGNATGARWWSRTAAKRAPYLPELRRGQPELADYMRKQTWRQHVDSWPSNDALPRRDPLTAFVRGVHSKLTC
jgi:hypothetical protein